MPISVGSTSGEVDSAVLEGVESASNSLCAPQGPGEGIEQAIVEIKTPETMILIQLFIFAIFVLDRHSYIYIVEPSTGDVISICGCGLYGVGDGIGSGVGVGPGSPTVGSVPFANSVTLSYPSVS